MCTEMLVLNLKMCVEYMFVFALFFVSSFFQKKSLAQVQYMSDFRVNSQIESRLETQVQTIPAILWLSLACI